MINMIKENKAEVDAYIFAHGIPPQWEVISANDVLRQSNDVGSFPSSYRPVMKMFGMFNILYMYILVILYRAKEKLLVIEGIDISETEDYKLGLVLTLDYYGLEVVPKDHSRGMKIRDLAHLLASRFLLMHEDIPLWEKAVVMPYAGVYRDGEVLWSEDHSYIEKVEEEVFRNVAVTENMLRNAQSGFMKRFYYDLPYGDGNIHGMLEWTSTVLWQALALNDVNAEDASYFYYTDSLGYKRMNRAGLYTYTRKTGDACGTYDRFIMFCMNLQLASDQTQGLWPSNHYPRKLSLGKLSAMMEVNNYVHVNSADMRHVLAVLEGFELGPHEDWSRVNGSMLHKHIRAIQQSRATLRVPVPLLEDVFSASCFKEFVAHIRKWGGYVKLDDSAWTIEKHLNDQRESSRMDDLEFYFIKSRIQILGSLFNRHASWMVEVRSLHERIGTEKELIPLQPGLVTAIASLKLDVARDVLNDPLCRTITEEE